ncbi:hypothetical protein [Shewanella algae]|uniref:hypothetical protein n=1 Tax=Shewanella algae TaxID=38313 RepID=UPI003AAF2443
MILSRMVYESLPYLYFFTGSLALYLLDPLLGILGSVLLILAAAWIYNLRSSHRRSDPKRLRRGGFWPDPLYAGLSFLWLLSGMLLLRFADKEVYQLLGLLICAWGSYILSQRHLYRRHKLPRQPLM